MTGVWIRRSRSEVGALQRVPAASEVSTGVTSEARDDTADESEVIERARGGDAHAFATLYDRYFERVYRHCYYRTADRSEAEDLTQETFLRAWRAIGRYRCTEVPFLAWLLTISDRLAISRWRRWRVSLSRRSAQRFASSSGAEDPEGSALTSLACDEVRRALLELSGERQRVLLLRFIDGLSLSEVAAALGKSEAAVAMLQHRALADLRRRLDCAEARETIAPR